MALREISKEQLDEILRKHALWCRGAAGGERANLRSANLSLANLRSADLRSANLRLADLSSANLSSADLRSADLDSIKHDVIAAILKLPNEIPFLRQAIVDGKIDGSTYRGECACLAGTMAHACDIDFTTFEQKRMFPIDVNSPRERWFLSIRKGDTPESNPASKITLGWVDEALSMIDLIRRTATAPSAS